MESISMENLNSYKEKGSDNEQSDFEKNFSDRIKCTSVDTEFKMDETILLKQSFKSNCQKVSFQEVKKNFYQTGIRNFKFSIKQESTNNENHHSNHESSVRIIKPNDYLFFSIFTTIFCFLPIGNLFYLKF